MEKEGSAPSRPLPPVGRPRPVPFVWGESPVRIDPRAPGPCFQRPVSPISDKSVSMLSTARSGFVLSKDKERKICNVVTPSLLTGKLLGYTLIYMERTNRDIIGGGITGHHKKGTGRDMKNTVIYTRVSTMRQADEGVSLPAQVDRAKAWSHGMGYTVAAQYEDAGISGKRADNRPGLVAALDHVSRTGGVLVVYSLSRLARSTKDAIMIAERLDKAGADLVSLSEQIDTTTAAGKMVFRMMAVLSEFERDLVSERTRAALSHIRATGKKTGGTVPFGFDADEDGTLVANEKEQESIDLIGSLRAKGYTLRAIAAELNRREIKSKTGKAWSAQTINAIVKRAA